MKHMYCDEEVIKQATLHRWSKSIEEGSGARQKVKEKEAKEHKQGRKMQTRGTTRSQVHSSLSLCHEVLFDIEY